MAKAKAKAMSVVTVNLKTEPWQVDVMNKRFELCRKVYNAMLGYEIKKHGKMKRDPRWIECQGIIEAEYAAMDDSDKKNKSYSPRLREAFETRNLLMREYGFSEYDFTSDVKIFYKDRMDYSSSISSTMASMSIAKPMWAAYYKIFFSSGKKKRKKKDEDEKKPMQVHFKKYGDFYSVATDGKSGIRLVNDMGETIHSLPDNGKMWLLYGTTKGKVLKMPVVIDKNDVYAKEGLSNRIAVVRITRALVKGKYMYQLQCTVEGQPPIKYDKETGEIKHPVGKGRVGIYIDTKYATVCTEDGIQVFDLSEGIPNYEAMRADINRYMDTSRRISNPGNYNEDGTIKKGIMENGKRVKLRWHNSNNYYKGRARRSELYRKEAVQRHLQREILSNALLAMGDDFVVNDYPFQVAAMRKEKEEKYPDGWNKSKKKAGKTIGQNAPATLVSLLDQKLKARGYEGVTKVKLKDVDYTAKAYRETYAKQMYAS